MTTKEIREKLAHYLELDDEQKLRAIYTLLKDEIDPIEYDWEDDFKIELSERSKAFNNGSAKTYTWEETKMAAINKVKSKENRPL
ncbi:MAG: hypothetical protein ABIW47_12030 [Ginsengibacter sp.]